ncbi:MAG: hypothetical protein JRC92_01160 [Deltaproteobacteria bacterium]|nr:hypothetical protein [Deltaproteobacteria bacterium]
MSTTSPPIDYGLTDEWLRRRLASGQEAGWGPVSAETWPAWEEALTSPEHGLRQAALLLLFEPMEATPVEHLARVARQAEGLVRVWEKTGESEVLSGLIGLIDAVDESPALDWLIGVITSGVGSPELNALVGRMARPISRERLTARPGSDLVATLSVLWGPAPAFIPFQVQSAAHLLKKTGLAGLRAKAQEVSRLAAAGRVEEALEAGGSDWRPIVFESAPVLELKGEAGVDPGRLLVWGDWPRQALNFFDQVLASWAEELMAVRRICTQTSQKTGRVVVALFNANLAASLAWGLPFLKGQAGASTEALIDRAREIEKELEGSLGRVRELKGMWLAREVRPGLVKALGRLADCLNLNGCPQELLPWLERCADLLGPGDEDLIQSHPWPVRLRHRSALEAAVRRVLVLARRRLDGWESDVVRSISLAQAGAEAMTAGGLASLALPLTEKFSASTLAGEDLDYLAGWLSLLRRDLPEALFLLFDDTTRSQAGLSRVIARLDGASGLGPFGSLPEDDPVGLIASQARSGELYALRAIPRRQPLTLGRGERRPHLAEWLATLDPSVLVPGVYDPCWKEGLTTLLTGTTAQPLLASADHLFPEDVLTGQGRSKCGAYCRARLKALIGEAVENEEASG